MTVAWPITLAAIVACWMLMVTPGLAQSDEEQAALIDEFIRNLTASESVIGASHAVVKLGRPLLAQGYGVKDLETGEPVTNRTLFYLASCTKAINAALLVKALAEDGRYTVDTVVKDIWPDFWLDKGYRTQFATLRDLLSHRSGTYDAIWGFALGAMQSEMDYISRARFLTSTEPFRGSYTYNNLYVTITGHVTEILTGMTWADVAKTNLFDPLGMTSSTFTDRLTQDDLDNMATPYEPDNGVPRPIDKGIFGPNLMVAAPSGDIVTNVEDMQKWLLLLTNKGKTEDGTQLINETDLMATMKSTSYPFPAPDPTNADKTISVVETGTALGWYSGYYRGYNMARHGGYFFGYQSLVTILPDVGMAVVSQITGSNGDQGDYMNRVAAFALDTLLRLDPPPRGYSANQNQNMMPRKGHEESSFRFAEESLPVESYEHAVTSPRFAGPEYAGQYGDFFFGNMSVFYNETSDTLSGTYGTLGFIDLVELSPDRFVGIVQEPYWFAPPIQFFFNSSDGQTIDQMTVPFLYPQAPPTFIRGLNLADAPPPDLDNCDDIN